MTHIFNLSLCLLKIPLHRFPVQERHFTKAGKKKKNSLQKAIVTPKYVLDIQSMVIQFEFFRYNKNNNFVLYQIGRRENEIFHHHSHYDCVTKSNNKYKILRVLSS